MLENELSRIATALELIAAALSAKPVTVATAPAQPVPVATAPAQPVPVATPVVAPVTVAPVVASPVMPAAPVFTPAAPTPPVTAVSAAPTTVTVSPFSDKNAMMDFVLSSYKALGPEKGAKIQDVLVAMGFANINDVNPERWGELKAGIEALRG